MTVKNEIALVTQENIRNKIYTIRGQRVMLDSDLAAIYGYTTKNFNRQIGRGRRRVGIAVFCFAYVCLRDAASA